MEEKPIIIAHIMSELEPLRHIDPFDKPQPTIYGHRKHWANADNFPTFLRDNPELDPGDLGATFVGIFLEERKTIEELLIEGLDSLSLNVLFEHLFLRMWPSQQAKKIIFRSELHKSKVLNTSLPSSYFDIHTLGEPELQYIAYSDIMYPEVLSILITKMIAELMKIPLEERTIAAKEFVERLKPITVKFIRKETRINWLNILMNTIQTTITQEGVLFHQAQGIAISPEFFETVAILAQECALWVSFDDRDVKAIAPFAYGYDLTVRGGVPPIEALPFITAAHLGYMLALPAEVPTKKMYDWLKLRTLTQDLLGAEFNFDRESFVARTILEDILRVLTAHGLDTEKVNKSNMTDLFYQVEDVEYQQRVVEILTELKVLREKIVSVLQLYHQNPQLLNEKSKGKGASVLKDFYQIRQEILEAGGRAPRHLKIAYRHDPTRGDKE